MHGVKHVFMKSCIIFTTPTVKMSGILQKNLELATHARPLNQFLVFEKFLFSRCPPFLRPAHILRSTWLSRPGFFHSVFFTF
jgi:hypothetical protein